ncbi:MAG: DUF1552 domain-containing protein [Myxococcota bacterium]
MNYRSSRRRFLQSLGLGAGASLLLPISDLLVRRAFGMADPPQKRLVLVSVYQMETENYIPDDVQRQKSENTVEPMVPSTWPEMFDPMAAYMHQAVFVDGLRNYIGSCQHRAGTCALSCLRPTEGSAEALGPAGGVTIDQHIAQVLSADRPFRSILWGLSQGWLQAEQLSSSGIFAAGPEQNLPHHTHAGEMMTQVFGELGGPDVEFTNEFRPLRDRLLEDVHRLALRLAPEERIALETYEQAVLAFDQRQEALSMVSCSEPEGGPTTTEAQDHLESMMAQSTLALQCGLTNVVAASIGTSNNHNKHQPRYRELDERTTDPSGEASFYGHGGGNPENRPYRLETKRHYHQIHLRELASLMDALATVPESDGSTALDHTVVAYVSGNGMSNFGHHSPKDSKALWTMLLVAGSQTGLSTGGRYMGCSLHEAKGDKWSLSDVYRAVALGLGVDPEGFGDPEHTGGIFERILT